MPPGRHFFGANPRITALILSPPGWSNLRFVGQLLHFHHIVSFRFSFQTHTCLSTPALNRPGAAGQKRTHADKCGHGPSSSRCDTSLCFLSYTSICVELVYSLFNMCPLIFETLCDITQFLLLSSCMPEINRHVTQEKHRDVSHLFAYGQWPHLVRVCPFLSVYAWHK